MKTSTAQQAGELTAALIALHLGPGPHPDGTPQSVHAGGQPTPPAKPASKPAPKPQPADTGDWAAYAKTPAAKLPAGYVNALDGGPGPSLQYHGTGLRTVNSFAAEQITFLTDDPKEAAGYAHGQHRMQSQPGQVLIVRRKPGPAIDISNRINELIANGDDPDVFITTQKPALLKAGVRYVYFEHPSFVYDDRAQHVLVALRPDEDLTVRKVHSRIGRQP